MQTLESADKIAPRSILRHRPIGEGESSIKHAAESGSSAQPVVPRASRAAITENSETAPEWHSNKTKKREADFRRRAMDTESIKLTELLRSRLALVKEKKGKYQASPLIYLGAGMVVALLLWISLSAVGGWFSTTLDDIHYGRPRTFQVDAWVGHNEQTGMPSHFIAVNLNRHIEIIEFPGGDPSRAKVYIGPQLYGANDELVPVTIKFIDVNKNHTPDMLVNFQGTHFVLINDQGSFRPMSSAEQSQIEQFLQRQG